MAQLFFSKQGFIVRSITKHAHRCDTSFSPQLDGQYRHQVSSRPACSLIDKWLEGVGQAAANESYFLKLPVELIRRMIYCILVVDYLCGRLAITCKYLLSIGREIIEQWRVVQNDTLVDDLPDSVLNAAQKEQVNTQIVAERVVMRAEYLAEGWDSDSDLDSDPSPAILSRG